MSFGQFLPKSLDSDLNLLNLEKEFSPLDIDLYRSLEDSDQTENVQGPSTSISFKDDGSVFYSVDIPTSSNFPGTPVIRSWGLTNPLSVQSGNFYTNIENMSSTIIGSFINTNSSLGYPYTRIDTAKFKDSGSKLLLGYNRPSSNNTGRVSSTPSIGIISYDNPSDYWTLNPSSYTTNSIGYLAPSEQSFDGFGGVLGVQFNSDGSKIFILNRIDQIKEYSLSIPWDITSNIVLQNTLDVSNEDLQAFGFTISDDGTKLFMIGSNTDSIYQYNLTSPYTLSGASYSNISYNYSGETTSLQYDIVFSNNGTTMHTFGVGEIFQYNLSTGYDLNTLSFDSSYPNGGYNYSGTFNPEGDRLYVLVGSYITEFNLSAPYDISSVVSSRTLYYYYTWGSDYPKDIKFSNDGNYLYLASELLTDLVRFPLSELYFPAEGSIIHTGILRREVSVDISNDGTKAIILDDAYSNPNVDVLSDNNNYQMFKSYTLSTPWDFSTAKFSGQYLLSTPGYGRLSVNEEGNRIYMISRDSVSNVENIHIFHLSESFEVSTIYKEEKRQIYSSPSSEIFAFTAEENGKRLYYHRNIEVKNAIYHYGTFPVLSFDNFYRGGRYVPDNNYFRSVCSVPESGEISYLDFYPVNSYSLLSTKDSSDEGQSFVVSLSSPTAPDGTVVSYSVSGISDSDLTSGSLNGNFILSSGYDSKTFTLSNDLLTEGPESFILSLEDLDSPFISVLINDTSRNFTNFDFSDQNFTEAGTTVSLNGWTAEISQVRLGIDTIGGFTCPSDPTPNPTGDGSQISPGDGTLDPSMNFYWELLTENDLINGSPSGKTCIRLYSSGSVSTFGDVSHGPYLISNDYLPINQGTTIGFDWRAAAGFDAYDVFAYLLKDDGTVQILLNETQNGMSGDTGWLTFTDTVDISGNYKFVFVGGTFDYSFGGQAGASLYVTNITIS